MSDAQKEEQNKGEENEKKEEKNDMEIEEPKVEQKEEQKKGPEEEKNNMEVEEKKDEQSKDIDKEKVCQNEDKKEEEKKEEIKEEIKEDKKEEIKEEVKEEDKKEEIKEGDKKEEIKEEDKKEEIKEEIKEEVKEEDKKENKKEEKPAENEDKEEEEDKKELYEAIQDLKSEVSENVKSKLLLLSDLHLEYKKFENDQYGFEYDSLQDKYDRQYIEIDNKIDEIVNSKENIQLTPEEMEQYGIKEECEPKEIEDYWEKVIINSRYFTITDKDKIILKYLTKVKIEKLPENLNDFRVDFYFKENEFFNNEILSKKYTYGKDSLIKKAEGTDIDWKSPDKNTTIEKVKKRIKKGKKYYNEIKETKVDSFFSFFAQVDDMNFITDEVTFFKEDLFTNQLEYYMDIVSKTKKGGLDDEDDDDDLDDDYDKNNKKDGKDEANDGKKEECKQQ